MVIKGIGNGFYKATIAQLNENGLKMRLDVWDVQYNEFFPIIRGSAIIQAVNRE